MFEKTTQPLIYLITEGKTTDSNFSEMSHRIIKLIRAAVEANVQLVQIREKQLSARLLFTFTKQLSEITKNSDTKLLVNDRADVALSAGADGVHLTSGSLPVRIIRRHFPPEFIIGKSCHALEEVLLTKTEKASFATFSPIFSTPNKGEPQGMEKLKVVSAAAKDFPVIALGGIDETNAEAVLKTGASGVAAIRLLNDEKRLSKFAEKIREFRFSD